MLQYGLVLIIAAGLSFSPGVSMAADVMVNEVVLAEDVQDREPVASLTPEASCKNGQNAGSKVPTFDSSTGDSVYFWNKIQTGSSGVLRHTWYKKGDDGWTQSAEVDLRFVESSGYRTWSSKRIVPSLHMGDWKIEVSTAEDPDQILCTARFHVN